MYIWSIHIRPKDSTDLANLPTLSNRRTHLCDKFAKKSFFLLRRAYPTLDLRTGSLSRQQDQIEEMLKKMRYFWKKKQTAKDFFIHPCFTSEEDSMEIKGRHTDRDMQSSETLDDGRGQMQLFVPYSLYGYLEL